MAYVVKDRVAVTTTSTGIGNLALGSAISGYQDFSAIGDGNQTFYSITDGTDWETGIGTVTDNWSNSFDGTGDFLSLGNNNAFNPGTSDFVMEAWVYITGTTGNNQGINGKGTSGTDGYSFYVTNALVLSFVWNGTGGTTITGGTLSLNTWHHVAVVRNDSVIRLYLDGVGAGSSTACTTNITSTATKYVGQARGANPILGYISNYRMTNGLRPNGYDATTSSLTVPTLALTSISGTSLLTCQSSTFIDNSPNNFTITRNGQVTAVNSTTPFSYESTLARNTVLSSTFTPVESYSVYFDGTGDSVYTPANTALALGSSDFTIELWYNPTGRLREFPSLINNGNFAANKWQLNDRHSYNSNKVAFHVYAYATSAAMLVSNTPIANGTWYHVAVTRSDSTFRLFVNGVLEANATQAGSITGASDSIYIGRDLNQDSFTPYTGYISNARIIIGNALYTENFSPPLEPLTAVSNTVLLTCQDSTLIDNSTNAFTLTAVGQARVDVYNPFYRKQVNWGAGTKNVTVSYLSENMSGSVPEADTSSINSDLQAWYNLEKQLDHGVINGVPYNNNSTGGVVSTYALIYTTTGAYAGGVLAPNGDIHFVPLAGVRGQKISADGVVSTYSLIHTGSAQSIGGVLAPNGDIHFVPYSAVRGQKVNSSGVVSTYSLVYTVGTAYNGGVLAPNGDIHFVPYSAVRGQKVNSSGVVSTYSLVYTVSQAYSGGVIAPNGDVHFVPYAAAVGQKISPAGVVSTYNLIHTVASAYQGGVLAPNGDIHFIPYTASVGQKVSIEGVVSTYSLVYTSSGAYWGGVLAPNGDIHFVPFNTIRGQKVSAAGVVSTYSLVYTTTNSYLGGVLAPNGDIHFISRNAIRGQKIATGVEIPVGYCLSPFFNKF